MLLAGKSKTGNAIRTFFLVAKKSSGENVKYDQRDDELGMGRHITRRDFLNGFGVAIGSLVLAPHSQWFAAFGSPNSPFAPEKNPNYYPPALTGMRGTTDQVMKVGHALRDGATWSVPKRDSEKYDLIVVGGGISGLSAAYFFRKAAGPNARILILENHDDFGGHARRNEFHASSGTIIGPQMA
jgi:spermidine dehydrogenase